MYRFASTKRSIEINKNKHKKFFVRMISKELSESNMILDYDFLDKRKTLMQFVKFASFQNVKMANLNDSIWQ